MRGHEDESTPGHRLKMICIDDSISHLRDEIQRCVRIAVVVPPASDGCLSDDHVFIDAIDGRKTVRACKRCNDHLGGQSRRNI